MPGASSLRADQLDQLLSSLQAARDTYTLALAAVASRADGAAGSTTAAATDNVSRLLDLGIEQLNPVLDFGARVERVTTRAAADERSAPRV